MVHQRSLSTLMNPLVFSTCALLLLGAFSAPAYTKRTKGPLLCSNLVRIVQTDSGFPPTELRFLSLPTAVPVTQQANSGPTGDPHVSALGDSLYLYRGEQ